MNPHSNPQETSIDNSSSREFPWRKSSARFHLVENPTKAPMNPEEVQLLRQGRQLMKQAKSESILYSTNATVQQEAPAHNKKRLFSFQRSKLRIFPMLKTE
jgi:hypothetical protein